MRTYAELFDAEVPHGVQRRIVKMVVDQYKQAATIATELFDTYEAHDQRGNIRRGLIDQALRGIVNSVPGARAVARPNSIGSCNHTFATFGTVALTQSRTSDPWERLPAADYRDAYVGEYQSYLIPPPNLPDRKLGTTVYAVIAHGPRLAEPHVPGFVYLIFPNGDGTHLARVDLFRRFPDLRPAITEVQGVEVVRKPAAKLRPGVKVERTERGGQA